MVEGDFDRKTVEYTGTRYTQSGSQGSGIRKDPSFSRWFDEDGKVQLDSELRNTDAAVEEDSDFELPFLQQGEVKNFVFNRERESNTKFQETRMHSSNSDTMDNPSVHPHGNGNKKYVPFDVENTPRVSVDLDGSVSEYKFRKMPLNSENPIDLANVVQTLFFILIWFFFSLLLTLYNKSLLGDDLGKFPAPLLMNTVHFAMQAVLSKAILWWWPHRFQSSVTMSWRDYFTRVVPTALGIALDVDLSNASLVFISVTFATMCKSAAPIFLLLFAFAFRLESPSIRLSGIILIISTGILLTVAKDTEFDLWGFILVMLAAVMSGFRWCMTQILLQKESYGLKNPLALMSYVTPVMTVVTLLLSVILDPWDEFRKNNYFNSIHHVTQSIMLMLFGGTLAFFMVLTEFFLVSVTSAVTVTIAGVVKEAITILVAVIYFHDEFSWLKGVGLSTIMVGVSLFNWYKYQKLQRGHQASDDDTESITSNADTKYIIIDDADGQDDNT